MARLSNRQKPLFNFTRQVLINTLQLSAVIPSMNYKHHIFRLLTHVSSLYVSLSICYCYHCQHIINANTQLV